MLKRTTVYLEQSEIETLKKISFIQETSMADLIRQGVQKICKSFSKEQKEALAYLAEIKNEAKKARVTPDHAMNEALKLQKEVRHGRKKSRR